MSFRDKCRPMHALAEDLKTYAGRRWPTANAKFRKARLADLLGFSERRVRSFWEASQYMSPRDEEVAAIKALIGQKEEADAADTALQKRIAELEAQVAFLVEALARDEMAAKRQTSRRQSRMATARGNGAADGREANPT